jgi:hypothetical protein
MKRLAIPSVVVALCLGLLLTGQSLHAQQGQGNIPIMDLGSAFQGGGAQQGRQSQRVQQDKSKQCARQANDQNLRGNERARFIQNCMAH